jgi:hypothetical protein
MARNEEMKIVFGAMSFGKPSMSQNSSWLLPIENEN